MTRVVALFEDGTATVDGIEADALGSHPDLPFLTEEARLAAARAAMADGDRELAERAVGRGVVAPTEGDVTLVRFVAPPDWDGLGAAVWDPANGAPHTVFTESTMLVGGIAVPGCVGRPFADDAARRDCALWCLRNGLDGIAERVARTPVGGEGPHCTWPDADLADPVDADSEPEPERTESPERALEEPEPDAPSNVVELFGGTFPRRIG